MKNDYVSKFRADCESSPSNRKMNRREFLRKAGCAGAGLAMAVMQQPLGAQTDGELPKRVLGRTNEKVSILGLGTAPVGEGPIGIEEGIKIFSEVIDRGVNYIDTARIYGNAHHPETA